MKGRPRTGAVASALLSAVALLAGCVTPPTDADGRAHLHAEVRAGSAIARVQTRSGPVLGHEQGGLSIFKGRRPVMVWLHGGGYATGSSHGAPHTDGSALARDGVVVVSLNHRLNALGFVDLSALGPRWQPDDPSAAALDAEGRRRHGAQWARVQQAHQASQPGTDLDDWVDTDVAFRRQAALLAERHAAAGGQVWRDRFDWRSPVLDGFFKSGHGAELPFAFGTTDRAAEATGGGAEARALAAQVSAAWRAFARDGDPQQALPTWAPYTAARRETMVIDRRLQMRQHPDATWLCANEPACSARNP